MVRQSTKPVGRAALNAGVIGMTILAAVAVKHRYDRRGELHLAGVVEEWRDIAASGHRRGPEGPKRNALPKPTQVEPGRL